MNLLSLSALRLVAAVAATFQIAHAPSNKPIYVVPNKSRVRQVGWSTRDPGVGRAHPHVYPKRECACATGSSGIAYTASGYLNHYHRGLRPANQPTPTPTRRRSWRRLTRPPRAEEVSKIVSCCCGSRIVLSSRDGCRMGS
ncbi:hypothetical protein R3P38DRAFT_600398 [Favolaschia claudopus]|uniref:Uncharacterized protein n=1 Tax=Favolaschia claudopus TaxID=2862362 RepID=A0AAV9Z7C5_9AGAR